MATSGLLLVLCLGIGAAFPTGMFDIFIPCMQAIPYLIFHCFPPCQEGDLMLQWASVL